jgi:hypothetical protein
MYVIGYTGDDVNEYDLSTAWDITTASYLQNFSVAAQEFLPHKASSSNPMAPRCMSLVFGDDVNEYDLGTAWDITTASYLQNFSVTTQEFQPTQAYSSNPMAPRCMSLVIPVTM